MRDTERTPLISHLKIDTFVCVRLASCQDLPVQTNLQSFRGSQWFSDLSCGCDMLRLLLCIELLRHVATLLLARGATASASAGWGRLAALYPAWQSIFQAGTTCIHSKCIMYTVYCTHTQTHTQTHTHRHTHTDTHTQTHTHRTHTQTHT